MIIPVLFFPICFLNANIVLVLFFILKLPCKNFLLNHFQLSAHINIPYHPHYLNSCQLSSFQFSWQSNWNCSILLLADLATPQPAPASQASPDVWQQNSGGLSGGQKAGIVTRTLLGAGRILLVLWCTRNVALLIWKSIKKTSSMSLPSSAILWISCRAWWILVL